MKKEKYIFYNNGQKYEITLLEKKKEKAVILIKNSKKEKIYHVPYNFFQKLVKKQKLDRRNRKIKKASIYMSFFLLIGGMKLQKDGFFDKIVYCKSLSEFKTKTDVSSQTYKDALINLEKNKKIDEQYKEKIREYILKKKEDPTIDFTIFSLNIKTLENIYSISEEELKEQKLKNISAYFKPSKHEIVYVDKYDFSNVIDHELTHLLNNIYYYKDGKEYIYSFVKEEDFMCKGNALNEGMTSYDCNDYSYNIEQEYIRQLQALCGEEYINKIFYEQNVDAIVDLFDQIKGTKQEASVLIRKMDDLTNKRLEEKNAKKYDEVFSLFIDYILEGHYQKITQNPDKFDQNYRNCILHLLEYESYLNRNINHGDYTFEALSHYINKVNVFQKRCLTFYKKMKGEEQLFCLAYPSKNGTRYLYPLDMGYIVFIEDQKGKKYKSVKVGTPEHIKELYEKQGRYLYKSISLTHYLKSLSEKPKEIHYKEFSQNIFYENEYVYQLLIDEENITEHSKEKDKIYFLKK